MPQSILEESRKAKRGIFGVIFKKKFLIIIAVLILAGASAYFIFGRNSKGQAAVAQVKNWAVKKEDLRISVSATGKVVAKDGVTLSFPVSGSLEVSAVYVKEGDQIKKGDQIAAVKTESLEFELRSAYNNYQSALTGLNTKLAGATESELLKSKTTVEQAEVALEQAKSSLASTKLSAAQSVVNAENSLATAERNYNSNRNVDDSESVRTSYNSLASTVKGIEVSAQRWLRESDAILGVDEISLNDDFEEVLGVKSSSSLSLAKLSYNTLKALRLELEPLVLNLTDAPAATIDLAADKARQLLLAAQTHFYDMQVMLDATITFTGLTQAELDALKNTASSDRTSVNSSLASLDSSIQSVRTAKNNLDSYRVAYEKAISDLEIAKTQAEQNVNNAEVTIRSREITLTQAQNDYADLLAGPTETDLSSARSQLASAAISVDKAKHNVSQATLISPIDGVIAMLNYKAGDIILSDGAKTMATIINNDTLFIETNIEEADISKLAVGDKVRAVFDAVGGASLDGEISFISLTSQTSSNGIVTYLVRVVFDNSAGLQIREGMTAALEFITAEARDVLTVPVAAVRNVGGNPSVQKSDGSFAAVVTGFTDGKKVEVISGLNEGEIVVY